MPQLTDRLPDALYQRLEQHFKHQQRQDVARGPFRYRAQAQVDRVYDGDTWFGRHRPDPTTVVAMAEAQRDDPDDRAGQYYRLSDVDTHELNARSEADRKKAKEEREFVRAWITEGRSAYDPAAGQRDAWPFILIYESNTFEGPFGRPLCDLIRKTDGQRLSRAILDNFPDRDLRYHASAAAREQTDAERHYRPNVGVPWGADPNHLP